MQLLFYIWSCNGLERHYFGTVLGSSSEEERKGSLAYNSGLSWVVLAFCVEREREADAKLPTRSSITLPKHMGFMRVPWKGSMKSLFTRKFMQRACWFLDSFFILTIYVLIIQSFYFSLFILLASMGLCVSYLLSGVAKLYTWNPPTKITMW